MSTCIAYRICFGILCEPWLPEPVPPATQVSPPGLVDWSALVTPGPVGQSLNSGDPPQGTRQLQRRPILREGGLGENFSPKFWIKFLSQNLAWICTDDSCVPKPTKLNTMIHLSHHRHGATRLIRLTVVVPGLFPTTTFSQHPFFLFA